MSHHSSRFIKSYIAELVLSYLNYQKFYCYFSFSYTTNHIEDTPLTSNSSQFPFVPFIPNYRCHHHSYKHIASVIPNLLPPKGVRVLG